MRLRFAFGNLFKYHNFITSWAILGFKLKSYDYDFRTVFINTFDNNNMIKNFFLLG